MTPSPPIRFGILGCARIARRGGIAGIQHAVDAELVAIASRSGETARAWATEYGIPKAYDSYAALVADPEIDAIYNPLPNDMHAEWTLRAAAAGKHVLCEKPLGLDLEGATRIVDGCRVAGVVLMEAFMWRHHPRVTEALRLVRSGRLGELRLVKMDFSFPIDPGEWLLEPARGGGALYDIGCYGINAARLFTGDEPIEIVARSRMSSSGVDMTTGLLLRFPRDVVALSDCSFEAPYRNRIEVVGTQGSLELPEGVLPSPESELVVTSLEGVERIRFPRADQYQGEVDAFCAGVRGGRLSYPAEDGLANMRVLDAARRQAWTGTCLCP